MLIWWLKMKMKRHLPLDSGGWAGRAPRVGSTIFIQESEIAHLGHTGWGRCPLLSYAQGGELTTRGMTDDSSCVKVPKFYRFCPLEIIHKWNYMIGNIFSCCCSDCTDDPNSFGVLKCITRWWRKYPFQYLAKYQARQLWVEYEAGRSAVLERITRWWGQGSPARNCLLTLPDYQQWNHHQWRCLLHHGGQSLYVTRRVHHFFCK